VLHRARDDGLGGRRLEPPIDSWHIVSAPNCVDGNVVVRIGSCRGVPAVYRAVLSKECGNQVGFVTTSFPTT
jgi:hypothetical protein